MKNYILSRIIKSIIALFVVLSIVIVMLFTLIPRVNIFKNDTSIQRMKGDEKTSYMYNKWDELGYLDFITFNEMCYASSDDVKACVSGDTKEAADILQEYENNGYTMTNLDALVRHKLQKMVYDFKNEQEKYLEDDTESKEV